MLWIENKLVQFCCEFEENFFISTTEKYINERMSSTFVAQIYFCIYSTMINKVMALSNLSKLGERKE